MLKQFVLAAILFVACSYADEAEVAIEDGVLVLTETNFDEVLKSHEFILVEFYAPWCGHCKNLAPEYAKAATQLAEEESAVKLAKVDATVEKSLGSRFEVRGYPTLKFFRDGKPVDYTGGRTADTIVSWVKKKSGPPAITISSKEDVEKLMENTVSVVGFFTDLESEAVKAFNKVAAENDEIMFGICTDEAVKKEYKMEKDGVSLFKHFDDKRADMTDDLTEESIADFVNRESVALLSEFSQEAAQKLFSKKGVAFFFLAIGKSSDDYETITDATRKVAKKHAGKVVAVLLNTEDKEALNVIQYLGIEEKDYPAYRMFNMEKTLKYSPEDPGVSEEKLDAFFTSYVNGDLKPFLKSADVPDNWDAEPVKILTGKNFKEVALDESKHVFVEFYAPWCGHCKKLTPIWEDLAKKFESVENLVIAKMDSTENEVEEVQVQGFPTLKFFPANSEEIIDYEGDRSLDDLVKFIGKHVDLPDEKEEEEKPEVPKEASKKEESKEKKDPKKDEL